MNTTLGNIVLHLEQAEEGLTKELESQVMSANPTCEQFKFMCYAIGELNNIIAELKKL